jgi:predicted nucleic acid-binding protein
MISKSRVCCDANLLIRSFEPEALEYPKAIALFEAWATERVAIIAPTLFTFEVMNAVYRSARDKRVSWDRANTILSALPSLPIRYFDTLDLGAETLEFARLLNGKTSYDAHYLALAKREQVTFYTADHRLANASRGRFEFVRDVMET